MNYTTLNDIKSFSPCESGWKKLLDGLGKTKADDEPLPYSKILEINGIADAIWSLRTSRKLAQAYAIACAESVLPIFETRRPGDMRVRECIEAAKGYIVGVVSLDELRLKRYAATAAYTAAAAYAVDAADAAADAADAAADAADSAADAADAAAGAADSAATAAYAADAAAYAVAADAADRQTFKAKILLEIVGV